MTILPIILAVLVVVYMVKHRSGPSQKEQVESIRTLRVIETLSVDLVPQVVGYGVTKPGWVWESVAEVKGTIISIHPSLKSGEMIKADTVLITIDPTEYQLAIARLIANVEQAQADGIIFFNRVYQPDINVDELEVVPKLQLSDSSELLLRLRWLAILSGRVDSSLAVSGGVHTAIDAPKAVMTGAHSVQMVSALLKKGPEHLSKEQKDMISWMEQHDYESIDQMRGSMNLHLSQPGAAFTREDYMRIL